MKSNNINKFEKNINNIQKKINKQNISTNNLIYHKFLLSKNNIYKQIQNKLIEKLSKDKDEFFKNFVRKLIEDNNILKLKELKELEELNEKIEKAVNSIPEGYNRETYINKLKEIITNSLN